MFCIVFLTFAASIIFYATMTIAPQGILKKKIGTALQDFGLLLKTFLLKGKTEKMLFLGLFLFYISYSIFIALSTSIIDHTSLQADIYFSYDNTLVFLKGRSQLTGHPLMVIFYYPFVLLGNFLVTLFGLKAKTILFVILTSLLTSISSVYIYRYLLEIIELNKKLSILLALLFACFSTNLILAFTPESFTLSAFFLSFTVYYYSTYIKKKQTPSLISSIILADICLGGVTVTHISKGIIPILFLKEKLSWIIKRCIIVGVVFLGILVSVHIIFMVIEGGGKDYFHSMLTHKELYSRDVSELSYLTYVLPHVFGAPILFPDIILEIRKNAIFPEIREGDYQFILQNIHMILLFILSVISLVINYRNRLVLMIATMLSVDVIIHLFFGFGINWPFMYGAHWVYTIPLLLGWLYTRIGNTQLKKMYIGLLIVLFVVLVANNLYYLRDFITEAITAFPPEQL